MRIVFAALLGAVALTLSQPAAASRLDDSEAAVAATIDRLGIDRSRIKSVFLAADNHPQDGPVPSYTGWVVFTDCRGNLVVDLTSTAATRALYTTVECRVPGVDHY